MTEEAPEPPPEEPAPVNPPFYGSLPPECCGGWGCYECMGEDPE